MKFKHLFGLFFVGAALIFVRPILGESTDRLAEELKPLEKLIGKWEAVLKNPKGEEVKIRTTFRSAANGGVVLVSGGANDEGQGMWYYDPELKKVVSIVVEDGFVVKRVFSPNDLSKEKISVATDYTTREGKRGVMIETFQWIDNDSYVLSQLSNFLEGEKQPTGPATTFKRIKN